MQEYQLYLTWILDDDHHVVDEVVRAEDVQLGVLGVGDRVLPHRHVQTPPRRHHLARLVHQLPRRLAQLPELEVELRHGLRRLVQRDALHQEHHLALLHWSVAAEDPLS